jgi:hypothetical protein
MYEVKMTEGILVGAQIKQLFEDKDYSRILNATERTVRGAFGIVCRNFLKPKKRINTMKI